MMVSRLMAIFIGLRRCFALMALFLVIAPCANATNLVFDTAGNIVGSYVGAKSIVADWVYSNGASGGAQAVSAGSAIVPTVAGDAAVATSFNATYTAARVAGIAVKVARAASVVGTAFTAWQVYNAIKDSGITTCPPPSFFCVPSPDNTQPSVVSTGWGDLSNQPAMGTGYTSGPAFCAAAASSNRFPGVVRTYTPDLHARTGYTASGTCYVYSTSPSEYPGTKDVVSCPTGYSYSATGGGACVANVPQNIPASDADITTKIASKQAADPNYSTKILNAVRADGATGGTLWSPSIIAPSDLPISVTTGPQTGPQVTTGTQTINNADGSTSTVTTKQQETVTPQVTGTTVNNTNITYNTSTTTTTTTVNNTTGATKTDTGTQTTPGTSNAAPGAVPTIPNDYNKEVTQQQVLKELGADGAPVMPDQSAVVTAAKTASDTTITQMQTDAQTHYQGDKSNWFSWVWTPPVGACQPFAGSVHGYAVSWDVCPTIANIQAVLGWLMAVFSGLTIYGQIFKESN